MGAGRSALMAGRSAGPAGGSSTPPPPRPGWTGSSTSAPWWAGDTWDHHRPGRPATPGLNRKEQSRVLRPCVRYPAYRRPGQQDLPDRLESAGHVEIDGSGMLQAAPDARPLTAVGQTFDIDMDRRLLGDIPTMAEYKVRCTVTRLIRDRLIEWTVRAVGSLPPAMSTAGRSGRSPTANVWSAITATGPASARNCGRGSAGPSCPLISGWRGLWRTSSGSRHGPDAANGTRSHALRSPGARGRDRPEGAVGMRCWCGRRQHRRDGARTGRSVQLGHGELVIAGQRILGDPA
jgi:hypothetical protein